MLGDEVCYGGFHRLFAFLVHAFMVVHNLGSATFAVKVKPNAAR